MQVRLTTSDKTMKDILEQYSELDKSYKKQVKDLRQSQISHANAINDVKIAKVAVDSMQLALQKESDKLNYKKAEVRTLQSAVNELQKTYTALKMKNEKQESELKATHAAEAAVKNQIDVFRQNAIEMTIKVNEVLKEKEEMVVKLNVSQSDLKRSIDNFDELQKRIKEERNKQLERLASQENLLIEKDTEIEGLKLDLTKAQERHEASLAEIADISTRLEVLSQERDKLRNMLLAASGDSELLMNLKSSRIKELEHQLLSADETYVQMHMQQAEVEDLRKRTKFAQENYSKLEEEIARLKHKVSDLEDFTNLLDLQNTALKSEIKFEKDAANISRHELKALKREHSKVNEALSVASNELASVNRLMAILRSEHDVKVQELTDLKQDLTRERLDKSVIVAEVSESLATKEYYEHRTKELEEMECRLSALKRQELELRCTVEKLEVANESLENELTCPVCFNLLENSLLAYPCSHSYCSHCAPPEKGPCVVCDAKIVRFLKCKLLDHLSAKVTYKRQALSALRQLLVV